MEYMDMEIMEVHLNIWNKAYIVSFFCKHKALDRNAIVI